MTQIPLVISPQLTFADLNRELGALGWSQSASAHVESPLVPGEPEFVSWSRGEDEHISYTFNPAVRLRVLVFYGPHAGEQSTEVERALPTVGFPELRELLQSTDARQLLLGIFAARELKAFTVVDLLEPLRSHKEEMVVRAARRAHEELLQFAIEIGAERLREEKKRHPERSALFPHLGDAHMRRQTLRWLIRDYREANEHINTVLRSGLADEDWEVRATAILAAVRLRARDLGNDIRRMELPRTSRNGPDETDRSILFAARKIILECLAQGAGDVQSQVTHATMGEEQWSSKQEILQHIRQCVLGFPVSRHDRIFMLINALTEPLGVEGSPPPKSPAITAHDETYRLKHSGLELCWIPPVAHWLGTDDKNLPALNPIRQSTPDQGYFIARRPLNTRTVQAIRSGAMNWPQSSEGESGSIFLCTWEEANRLCRQLGELEKVIVQLPSADQREMAARGTDGRRFPWGSGFEGDPVNLSSPWDMEMVAGSHSEWTCTPGNHHAWVTCGGSVDLRCAFRGLTPIENSETQHAVRPVVFLTSRSKAD